MENSMNKTQNHKNLKAKIIIFFTLSIILFAGIIFTGCNLTNYKVHFVVDNAIYKTIETPGNKSINLPDNPVKEGYDFDGWFYDNGQWELPFNKDSLKIEPIKNDLKVYAKWEDDYYLDLKLNGFTKASDSTYHITVPNNCEMINFSNIVQVNGGSDWILCDEISAKQEIPSKIGTLNIGNNTYYILVTATTGDVKLYTINIRRQLAYKVSFNTDGGSQIADQFINEGNCATLPESPTKTGYTFLRWNFDFSTPITEETIITAIYQANTYKITYCSNNGKGQTSEQSFVYNTEVALKNNIFDFEGYDFIGWGLNENQKTADYSPYYVFEKESFANNFNLYAIWKPILYPIIFNLNGGTNLNDCYYYTIESNDIILKDAIKEGWYFEGWYLDSEYQNKIEKIPAGSSGEITLYAKFKALDNSTQVYIYDAGDNDSFIESTNSYKDISSLLKTNAVNRNIIMYAIGGTNNMNNEKITLRREIKNLASVTMFEIDEAAYHEYNLIFAPLSIADNPTIEDIRKQIIDDNYELRRQMIFEGKSITSNSDIAAFLSEHKYLIVTTEENSFNGEAIDNTKEIGAALTIEEYIEKGFAFIVPKNTNLSTFKNQRYFFYYYAKTEGFLERLKYHTLNINENYSDNETPVISFNNNLQSIYSKNAIINFDAGTSIDSYDNNLHTVTAYRFLNQNKEAISSTDTITLKHYIEKTNEVHTDKWYAQTNKIVNSDGWYYNKDATNYTINLQNSPENTKYVEIFVFSIDDSGNAEFFDKIIEILDIEDNDTPTLLKSENIPDTNSTYEAPIQITLPTLYYQDSNAYYLHSVATLYKITNESSLKIQIKETQTMYDTTNNLYKISIGSFNATMEGNYQLEIIIYDIGNHNITTYYNYTVGSTTAEFPDIENISSDPISIEIGQARYLEPPTINIKENNIYGYMGIEDNNGIYTSTIYNISVISATDNNYECDYYFIGNKEGVYKLQYKVYLLQYIKSADCLSIDNNKLIYTFNGTNYFVYIDIDNGFTLTANTTLQGDGTTISSEGLEILTNFVNIYTLESCILTINVGNTTTLNENSYQTSYSNEITSIKIIKPTTYTFSNPSYQLDFADSKVIIMKTTGSVTITFAELNLADWGDDISSNTDFDKKENGDIYLKLSGSGKYTIKYSLQAMDQSGLNIGSPETIQYSFLYGDNETPIIEVNSDLIKAVYTQNETLSINITNLLVYDNFTTKDKLLKNITITIKNTYLDTASVHIYPTSGNSNIYSYILQELGSYLISISITDESGNKTTEQITFLVI